MLRRLVYLLRRRFSLLVPFSCIRIRSYIAEEASSSRTGSIGISLSCATSALCESLFFLRSLVFGDLLKSLDNRIGELDCSRGCRLASRRSERFVDLSVGAYKL